jgi:hypothetical protein
MTGTQSDEYRRLALESSNLLMEHDSRSVLGRYEEAADRVLVHAGQGKPNNWNAHGTHGDSWQAHTDQAVAAATHVAGEIVAGAESALKAGVGAVGSLINGAVAALPKGEAAGGPQVKQ